MDAKVIINGATQSRITQLELKAATSKRFKELEHDSDCVDFAAFLIAMNDLDRSEIEKHIKQAMEGYYSNDDFFNNSDYFTKDKYNCCNYQIKWKKSVS